MPDKLIEFLYQKKCFFLALIIALAVTWVSFTYIDMTQTPIESMDLTPASEADAWTYTLADGTELDPDETGAFTLPSPDALLYCTRSLAEYESILTVSALLAVNTRTCDAAIFADSALLADPTHRFDEAAGAFSPATGKGSNGGLFTLGRASELTIAVRFLTENASVAALPSLELFMDTPAYYSQWMSAAARSALPAGVFLAAALFLVILFLFQFYHGRINWGLLLLSLLALAFGMQNTVSYGGQVVWFLQSPVVLWALQILPALIILWLLWYHTNGGLRRSGWLLPLLCAAGTAAGVIWRLWDNVSGAKWTNHLQGKLLPLAMLLALVCCGWQAYRKQEFYGRFFRWGGCLAAGNAVLTLFSFLMKGSWWQSLTVMCRNVAMLGSFYQPMQQLNHLLLLLFFLLAVYDFIQSIVRRDLELRTLTLQNRYTAEHAAHLRRSLDDTHALRHEIRHHIEALRTLCREGNLLRVSDYVESIGGAMGDVPGRYTDHPLVNALVASCAQQAKGLGASFEAIVQLPEQIAVEDTDLAVLISNMIDNALEALATVPEGKDRRLQIKIEIFESAGLFVSCINSFSGKLRWGKNGELLSTKEGPDHGLGLKAMHRVAEKYNSVMVLEQEGGLFHAKTYLYFKQK